ncbi:MAG: 50S ribosomal protein L9 [Deltaproteobacteria bacterium]|nr:50S ribosomal protein L9 [Deltaproteobacteria bacterium]
MKVILQEDVDNLGQVGEIVDVRAGYARNFLVPRKKAVVASLASIKHLEHQKRLTEKRKAQLRDESLELAKKMGEVQVSITAKVGEQDKLFGSVTAKDIAVELTKAGHAVTARNVKLEHPIKTVGMHKVDVRLQAGVMAAVKVWVVAENPPPVEPKEGETEKPADKAAAAPAAG